ncbi:lipoate-protein ligase A [Aquipluma nitroreducens]|uniref:lipoate--protein ligase n=1 Tax=Aquipluma nitroreducens TaxID=2010828 RepID=A0A5K7S9C3_9BACT|nr:lipoate--protein ligase [Aquipluma nitroreducens]BBE18178.1 lipoate-protein ligase A [Aquipluma nitroreducens]
MITLCINQTSTDPYFNLAAEEYFLKNFEEDFFMLWRSRPSVVVGKHQNALAEINHEFVRTHQIPVARRLSGGGTVFHDPGNVNFTFIRNVKDISEVNFKVFTVPVIEALKKLGIEAYTTGRNDLLIDGKKISGNAEHVHRNRVLHHGTLLFDSHLEALKGALKVDLSKYEDKAVQSNRSEVTNIADYLPNPISVEEFTDFLFGKISKNYTEFQVYEPTLEDIEAIQKLSIEKYQTWDWIFGYSPRYCFTNSMNTANGAISVSLLVEKGYLAEASFSGAISAEISQKIAEVLAGCRHDYEAVKAALLGLEDEFQQNGLSFDELMNGMF